MRGGLPEKCPACGANVVPHLKDCPICHREQKENADGINLVLVMALIGIVILIVQNWPR